MKLIIQNIKASLLILILAIGFSAMANVPEDFTKGIVILKNGQTLTGLVYPLGKFNKAGTIFRDAKSGRETFIDHSMIERVKYDGEWFLPASFVMNGKTIQGYLSQRTDGAVNLYKAYYYAPKSMGKNNTMIQKQWTWAVSNSHHGPVAIGQNPGPKQLAKVMEHPLVNFDIKTNKLDEVGIIRAVQEFNILVAGAAVDKNEM